MMSDGRLQGSEYAAYRALISDVELTDKDKDEIIAIVRSIMQTFVDQAFELDPVQLATRSQDVDSIQSFTICARLPGPEDARRASSELDPSKALAP